MAVRRLVVIALAFAATAFAQGVDVPVDRYRQAASLGELGAIRGRAFEERRKPSAPDYPLVGTVVVLVPRSEEWILRLGAIKRGVRESIDGYLAAGSAVRRSWESYEKRLWEVGAGDLPQTIAVDSEGVFSFDGVPAGPWVLLASRSLYVNKTPPFRPGVPRLPPPPSPFLPFDRLSGYHVVTYWMREVAVGAGANEAIELTDRNIWLTGISENRQPPPLPTGPYVPPR